MAACSMAAMPRSSSSRVGALVVTSPVARRMPWPAGEVGLLLQDVGVLGGLCGVLDLPEAGTLGGVGEVPGLLPPQVAGGEVGPHGGERQAERVRHAGGGQQWL